jgi:CHAT domain-containing protein
LTCSEIAGSLAPGEAVVEYFLGTEGSLCFVLRREGVQGVRLSLTATEADASIDTLRRSLAAPRSLMTLTFDETVARRLGARLVDPIRSAIAGVGRLNVVPDAALNALPFEALLLGAPEAGGAAEAIDATEPAPALYAAMQRRRFFGDEVAIVYLPAASLLNRRSAARSSGPNALRRELMAIGGGAEGPRRSASEVERIGRLRPGATLRVGAAATERCFKELGPSHRLLHVSAHGAVDAAAPLLSSLRLAPDPDGREDGDLHAYEVLPLRLSCDLVTLSACESGLGKVYAGEGVLGMARAFLRAGARSALVSLWRVNDESTARFMEHFYKLVLTGVPPAEAVQRAKQELRRESIRTADGREISLAHPFFWAPFVLVDGGGAASGAASDERSGAAQSR